ncbi:hypothetical protein FA95DRAFT_1562463 [Auriscalpium vulgare]|uniref:Uncharacterized protein n=1 Tax=Auriscalpium vulgare TaxID=40419 RepID=A0ACB8RKM3_9AGAM|nr:hypothetical protein FA95DRAFT_1562463 [Auriscalpium vulgare]
MIPTYYLSIDCGGTKTAAAVASSTGAIVARAKAGGSNYAYLGLDAFLTVINLVVSASLSQALGLTSQLPLPIDPALSGDNTDAVLIPRFNLQAVWLGVSGVDSPAAVARLVPLVAELIGLPAERVIITNDTHLLAAPLRVLPDVQSAVAAIGGTGSIVVSFREGAARGAPLTELARAGGWGWILGDEGGGFDVGRTAIRALLTQRDAESAGEPVHHGQLRTAVLTHFGVEDVLDLLEAVHLPDSKGIAREKRLSSLSPLVFDVAFEKGDPLALAVLEDCAHKLAAQIETALLPASATEVHPKKVLASSSVVCFGGSLVGIEHYRELVLKALAEHGHVFRRVELVDDAAAVGARALAAAWETS